MADLESVPMTTQLAFPDGLVGLPELVRFIVAPVDGTVFFELASLDDPNFRVMAADADVICAGMSASLVERGLVSERAEVFVILALHGDPPNITANLAGPLAIQDGIGQQLVLEDPAFPLRVPVVGVA